MAYKPGDVNYGTVYGRKFNKGEQSFNRMRNLSLGALGGIAAAPALGALVGGGGVASVPGAVGASSAPLGGGTVGGAVAGKFSLGSLLGSKGMELGVGLGTNLLGMRSQNKANRYTTDRNAELTREQMRLENERLVRAEAAEAADRADAERRWMAEQAFAKSQFDANEEERAYTRGISDRQLRLDDEREARRAPYRQYSERAMRTLGSLLGIGG